MLGLGDTQSDRQILDCKKKKKKVKKKSNILNVGSVCLGVVSLTFSYPSTLC